MSDYLADNVSSSAGATITERSGTASADTVQAGSVVVWRNTGASSHTVTLTTNNTVGDLAVADRSIAIPAGQVRAARVPVEWGDVNRRVQVGIDGTASEVKYYVLGGV